MGHPDSTYLRVDLLLEISLTVQLDELWSFVDDKGNEQWWVWLALDAETREIVGATSEIALVSRLKRFGGLCQRSNVHVQFARRFLGVLPRTTLSYMYRDVPQKGVFRIRVNRYSPG
jgi:hypothetical protein